MGSGISQGCRHRAGACSTHTCHRKSHLQLENRLQMAKLISKVLSKTEKQVDLSVFEESSPALLPNPNFQQIIEKNDKVGYKLRLKCQEQHEASLRFRCDHLANERVGN